MYLKFFTFLIISTNLFADASIRPISTYSIVAYDEKTGELGVAVQSHWFSVGTVVPWAKAGVGAVATQSIAEPSYGPKGLALMEQGMPADEVLKSLLARISLIMGNLSAAGVNLLESLEIAKSVSSNVVVTEALENVKKGVFSGDTLTKLFLKEPLFPPTFSQLISVGEQTGQLDEMFNSVASYYESEFDTAVDNMSSLIEPIMIVFMGLMIGGLMIAMYSPIFNVGALIG